MSSPNTANRPVRDRTAVSTYNLKVLSSSAQHTHKSCLQEDRTLDPKSIASSPLSSPMTLPPISSSSGTPPQCAADNTTSQFQCFNQVSNSHGHYYSAPTLHARGVWIGHLAPDAQKRSYRGLPSYSQLKANFNDISLPFPPSSASTAVKNREAVCRGCLGEQSALLTLREIPFVKNRSVVIMPLDGDDELGTFCILLPQPMDRAMKNLQGWRPYEVKNGGDGSKFNNKFVLFTLRYADHDIGTLETVLATLRPQNSQYNAMRPTSRNITTPPTAELVLSAGEESNESIKSTSRKRKARARDSTNDSGFLSSLRGSKRKQKEVTILSFSKNNQRRLSKNRPSPNAMGSTTTSELPAVSDVQPPLASRNAPGSSKQGHSNYKGSSRISVPRLTNEQVQNIDIVWTLDVDGQACDFPLTLAKFKSFSELLEGMREMARYCPPAAVLLDKTELWCLTYTQPNGTRKTEMTLKGEETAFARMQTALRQTRLSAGDRLDVVIRAM